jgi:hypothetical protein
MTRLGNGDWLLDFALELSEKALVFVANMVISANGPLDALAVVIALASSSLAICSKKAPIFAGLILFFSFFWASSGTYKLNSRAKFAVCSFHYAKRAVCNPVRSANRVVFCRTERAIALPFGSKELALLIAAFLARRLVAATNCQIDVIAH